MATTCVGIEIGFCELHMAVCSEGKVKQVLTKELPENLVRDGQVVSIEAMAEFIKKAVSEEKIKVRKAAVILPSSVCYTRTLEMPAMTAEDLELNLPYEFRDFIAHDKDRYFYDYAVIDRTDDESGNPVEFSLIAATTLKETIEEYTHLCHRAGFKLITAIPEELAYMNLIRLNKKAEEDAEYCFLDLGHSAIRLHIYKGIAHQASRVIEYGMQMLDEIIADELSVAVRTARAYKHTNNQNELESQRCQDFYSTVVMEVLRALNFYRFNSPDSNLQDVYICGGGYKVKPLVERITQELEVQIHSVEDLLPSGAAGFDDAVLCQTAIGVALQ